jgi:2-iminobutanoate/2-iminopropanoate deaminase
MRHILHTDAAPTSPLYSLGVRIGSHIQVSGLIGLDVAAGQLAGSSIQEPTRQALSNCRAVLHAGGATLDDVVEVGVVLADPDDFGGMNEEYTTWFPSDPPCRYAAKLGAVIPGVLVSIRMMAIVE